MQGLYGIEFLTSRPRRPRLAWLAVALLANALLCRIDPQACFRIELPSMLDWEHGAEDDIAARACAPKSGRERRIGRRFALAAEFEVGGAEFVVASVHFEDKFGGPRGRFRHFRSVVEAIDAQAPGGNSDATVVVAGDFNTFDRRWRGW